MGEADGRGAARIVVIGCGAIGLPLAVAFASRGVAVTGFDTDTAKIKRLRAGDCGLLDEGLAPALAAALASGAIRFESDLTAGEAPRAFVIAVPTPVDDQDRFVDAPLNAAIASVADVARDGDLIAIRSTTPVGTARRLSAGTGGRFAIAACPDRSLSGRAFAEQFSVPHLVCGIDEAATETACALFSRLGAVRRLSSPEAAEATKLFANVWRDARFALANQLALYCEGAGMDLEEIRAAGADGFPRFDLPRAGPVGGPCLTKDVYLLAPPGADGLSLFKQARRVNQGLADHVAGRIASALPAPARVAVLGLAFKGSPPTLDARGSTALAIARALSDAGFLVKTWDPAGDAPQGATLAVSGAEAVVLANDHAALADPRLLDGCAEGALVYDLCGVLPAGAAARADLIVERLGGGRR